ncbi:MAG: molecular chaperone [Rhodospirillales bacterium]|nr:molecular chaperone [Rhodospirillales bacterium]
MLVGMILLATGSIQTAMAQGAGDLIVAPTRVVLEGRTRTAQLTLSNTGSNTSTYRISIVNLRMNDDGSVTEITEPDPGQNFAEKLFRYSPRQITLAPGETQTVRILLRKPKDLADGEYRSHIFFRAVPDEAGQSVNQTATANGLQIRLIPVYGITLPIIVRHGKVALSTSLSEMKVSPPDDTNPLPTLGFRISRDGNTSAFGDFTATHISPSGEKTVIGEIQRLAVYTPNKSRTVKISLRVPDGLKLSEGEISLAFRAIEEDGGKILAESSLKLP